MPRIIFIRSAETDRHAFDLIPGRCEVDLNEAGRAQADQLAEELSVFPITFLGSSPLKRALTTALRISDWQDSLSVVPIAGFMAMDMGDWENMSRDEILRNDKIRYHSFLTDPDFPAPGGESKREVYARAFNELVHIVKYTEDQETIALMLQETVMQVLCCAALDLSLESAHRFKIDNGAYAIFERIFPSGPYQLRAWNRNAHLKPFLPMEELEEITAV